MASAQFIHIETYGKKSAKKAERKNLNHNSDVRQTTISGVLAEARRDVGFTSHIEDPHAPARSNSRHHARNGGANTSAKPPPRCLQEQQGSPARAPTAAR